MRTFKSILAAAVLSSLAACGGGSSATQCDVLHQTEIEPQQSAAYLIQAKKAINSPYRWGGQSMVEGFDCSGLIVWALQQAGISNRFSAGQSAEADITADVMYLHNSDPVAPQNMLPGDLIFFDADSNGTKEHVSIYLAPATEADSFTVLDAFSTEGSVKIRTIDNFWQKNPEFARLKITKTTCD